MFHYPSQLSDLWGRETVVLPWNAVIGRASSQIIATSQVVAKRRNLTLWARDVKKV
jgi:hypothetical protein